MALPTAQDFYGAENMLTTLVINVQKSDELKKTKEELIAILDDGLYEVMDWKEMNPELVQQIQSDAAGGNIMLGTLYLIVGFGVLGTLIMMVTERRKEFGVMVAVGMQKRRLGMILVYEMLLMGLVGIITGIVGSFPVISYLRSHPIEFTGEGAELFESYGFDPIMPAIFDLHSYIGQTVVILVIFILASVMPIRYVLRLNEIRALRS